MSNGYKYILKTILHLLIVTPLMMIGIRLKEVWDTIDNVILQEVVPQIPKDTLWKLTSTLILIILLLLIAIAILSHKLMKKPKEILVTSNHK